MMQCRMCSQRLTRPGRLCRECEHELKRAEHAGYSIGEASPLDALAQAQPLAGREWLARLRAPGSVVTVAFAVGIAGAVTLHLADRSEAAQPRGSVMLDLNPGKVRQVSIVSPGAVANAESQPVPVAAETTVGVSSQAATNAGNPAASSTPGSSAARSRPRRPVQAAALEAREAPENAAATTERPAMAPAPDASAAFGDALARCVDEPFLQRPACQERARARYCDAASPLPGCVPPPREYGQ